MCVLGGHTLTQPLFWVNYACGQRGGRLLYVSSRSGHGDVSPQYNRDDVITAAGQTVCVCRGEDMFRRQGYMPSTHMCTH